MKQVALYCKLSIAMMSSELNEREIKTVPSIERFANPPIKEALIDLAVDPREDLTSTELDFYNLIAKDYPQKKELRSFESRMVPTVRGPEPSAKDMGINAFHFTSEDDTKRIQSKINGYTFNRLAPYESWEEMVTLAKQGWDLYRDKMQPQKVTRIAARYVNVINIPSRDIAINNYFNMYPVLPDGLPSLVDDFFFKISSNFSEIGATAIVTMASAQRIAPDISSVILDIDVFLSKRLEPADEGIWTILERLRSIKNEIFVTIVTDKTKELFR